MECPVCKKPMVVLELNRVETDHCLTCKGIWLDAGELELILEGAAGKDTLLNSFQALSQGKEKRRRCPICSKKMEKILCGRDKKILIDKCRNNDGLWFDLGELYEIIMIGGFDKENKVLLILRDMFKESLKK